MDTAIKLFATQAPSNTQSTLTRKAAAILIQAMWRRIHTKKKYEWVIVSGVKKIIEKGTELKKALNALSSNNTKPGVEKKGTKALAKTTKPLNKSLVEITKSASKKKDAKKKAKEGAPTLDDALKTLNTKKQSSKKEAISPIIFQFLKETIISQLINNAVDYGVYYLAGIINTFQAGARKI